MATKPAAPYVTFDRAALSGDPDRLSEADRKARAGYETARADMARGSYRDQAPVPLVPQLADHPAWIVGYVAALRDIAPEDLDRLWATATAFQGVAEATTGTSPDYRPSLWAGSDRPGRVALILATDYDAAQAARGDARRAFRGW